MVGKCTIFDIYLYWIFAANIKGIYVNGRVSVRPSGAGSGNVHFLIYIVVSDICCQHMGNICHKEGFCAPFGRMVGECTIFNI